MPRLLMVTTVPGTLRAFLLPFARHFRSLGWRVDAVARDVSTVPECVDSFDKVWDVDWSRNPFDPRNLLAAPNVLRGIVEQQKYDIVHVHTPVAAFVTRYALRGWRNRGRPAVVYTAHGFHFFRGGHPLRNAAFLGLEKLAGRWMDYLVVINREDGSAARRYALAPAERIVYMPGIGVDTDYYNPEKVDAQEIKRVRGEMGLVPEDSLFVMIAEFNPGKRHRDLIRALARLNRQNVHLALAGTGRLFEEMKQLAKRLGLCERVHFLGYRRDIPALIRASCAVSLPSVREGLPRSVMESLCLAVPVIGSRIRGTQELLEDGCGVLVDVGDVGGLAKAMAWMVDHPERAMAMGRAGRQKMKDYDLRRIIGLHEDLYDLVLNG